MIECTPKMNNYQQLIRDEQVSLNTTTDTLAGYMKIVPRFISLLVQLSHHHSSDNHYQENSKEHFYNQFCFYTYFHLPFTIRSIMLLTNRGYYNEASQLIRHIFELAVKIKYCTKYMDRTEAVWLNNDYKGQKITITRMFESVVPGLKDKYGLLSGFTHGGSSTNMFKVDYGRKIGDQVRVRTGTFYDEDGASFVINQIYAYLHILFRQFKTSFPETYIALPENILAELDTCIKICEQARQDHIDVRPQSQNWYRALDQLSEV